MTDKRTYELLAESDKVPQDDKKIITLSNGVQLRLKKVPPMVLAQIERKFPRPPVPELWDEGKGRNIHNPNAPSYLEAVARNEENKGLALMDVLLGLGTEIVSIPPDFPAPDDDSWVVDREPFVGEIPASGNPRYLAWLKYVVIEETRDFTEITRHIQGLAGVMEEDVAAAIDSFPGEKG